MAASSSACTLIILDPICNKSPPKLMYVIEGDVHAARQYAVEQQLVQTDKRSCLVAFPSLKPVKMTGPYPEPVGEEEERDASLWSLSSALGGLDSTRVYEQYDDHCEVYVAHASQQECCEAEHPNKLWLVSSSTTPISQADIKLILSGIYALNA
jgi:hypothetical protein